MKALGSSFLLFAEILFRIRPVKITSSIAFLWPLVKTTNDSDVNFFQGKNFMAIRLLRSNISLGLRST